MNRRGEATRNQIMDVAARLFAQQGIDGVTMAEIHEATGQRNKSAIQYHFGSRRGLVQAIVDRHKDQADELRAPMLADTAEDDLPGLVRALVRPALPNLDSAQGRYYLRIVASLLERFDPEDQLEVVGGLLARTLELIGDCRPELVGSVRTNRLVAALGLMAHSLSIRASRLDEGNREVLDPATFESETISMIIGLVTAPTVDEAPGPLLASSGSRSD